MFNNNFLLMVFAKFMPRVAIKSISLILCGEIKKLF